MKTIIYAGIISTLLFASCNKDTTEDQTNTDTTATEKKDDTNTQTISLPENEYVSRSDQYVEKVFLELNKETMEPTEIYYQGDKDAQAVKLTILSKDTEKSRIITEHPKTKEKITFSSDWAMGGAKVLSEDQYQEFYPEITCKSDKGQVITTSGGPFFIPFFYSADEKSSLKKVEILNPDSVPESDDNGSSIFKVKLPNQSGTWTLTMLPYEENNPKTRIILTDADGNKTSFNE